ncbi:MAG: hypothetical protein ACE147_02655 [Candidatus Methylomirabilales bacterium]
MARLVVALALLLVAARPLAAGTAAPELWVWKGATLAPLVTPAAFSDLHVRLASQFEVLDGRVVGLTSGGELLDLTARRLLPAATPLGITSVSADRQLLIVVRGRRLGVYEAGAVAEKVQLPQDGLTVVAGAKQRLYLYGPQGAGAVIYLLEQGRAGTLLEIPDGRISALSVIGERLFFAVGNAIFTVAEGQRPAIVFVAAGESDIRSIAPDPRTGLLYFSAGDTVYAMRAGMAVSILRGLEGILRYAGDGLYVLDPWQGSLVKLQGLEKLLELGAGASQSGAEGPPAEFKE